MMRVSNSNAFGWLVACVLMVFGMVIGTWADRAVAAGGWLMASILYEIIKRHDA